GQHVHGAEPRPRRVHEQRLDGGAPRRPGALRFGDRRDAVAAVPGGPLLRLRAPLLRLQRFRPGRAAVDPGAPGGEGVLPARPGPRDRPARLGQAPLRPTPDPRPAPGPPPDTGGLRATGDHRLADGRLDPSAAGARGGPVRAPPRVPRWIRVQAVRRVLPARRRTQGVGAGVPAYGRRRPHPAPGGAADPRHGAPCPAAAARPRSPRPGIDGDPASREAGRAVPARPCRGGAGPGARPGAGPLPAGRNRL
ncbi:MAG: hypothetical protein AVDCRST_MAG66-721, partial [uncultured Pseudonocardia sp.]